MIEKKAIINKVIRSNIPFIAKKALLSSILTNKDLISIQKEFEDLIIKTRNLKEIKLLEKKGLLLIDPSFIEKLITKINEINNLKEKVEVLSFCMERYCSVYHEKLNIINKINNVRYKILNEIEEKEREKIKKIENINNNIKTVFFINLSNLFYSHIFGFKPGLFIGKIMFLSGFPILALSGYCYYLKNRYNKMKTKIGFYSLNEYDWTMYDDLTSFDLNRGNKRYELIERAYENKN